MKTIVVYYSGKGSNKFLAEKTAEALKCGAVELKPRVAGAGLVMFATMTKMSFGNRPVKVDFSEYDRVVLCGPLYVGNIASPCSDFIKKYSGQIKHLDFLTCCASTDEKKDDKFGYNTVFQRIEEQLGSRCGVCRAFPIELILTDEQKGDDQAAMNTRLNSDTINDAVQSRIGEFVAQITGA